MKWLNKLRRAWIAVFARSKHRKSPGNSGRGSGGGSGGGIGGLKKLQDEVQTCGYQDVHIMWNIISKSADYQDNTWSRLPQLSTHKASNGLSHTQSHLYADLETVIN